MSAGPPGAPSPGSRLAILGAAAIWSTGGAAIKLASVSGAFIASGRAAFAAIALFLLLPSARLRWNRAILRVAFFYAGCCTLFVFSNTLTTAGNTIFIQNTAPVWVMLLSPWLLGERATRAEKLSLPVSMLGCALFFADDFSFGRLAGNLLALGASFFYALLIVSYRKVSSAEGLAGTVAGNVLIVVSMLPFVSGSPAPGLQDVAVLAYLGLVQQGVAAVLFIRGIRGVSALEGALLILFEPLLTPLWAFLLVQEKLGAFAMTGAVLIVGSTVYRALARGPQGAAQMQT